MTSATEHDPQTFQAWALGAAPLDLQIADSPCGRIGVRAFAGQAFIGGAGSAIVLPCGPVHVRWGIEAPAVFATLGAGCYALVPGGAELHGTGLIIYTPDYAGLPQMGGPVEPLGRLAYIDGCSDSLLICPAKLGDPCLNLLHLPEEINQTQHTHPSDRIGIILRGAGRCVTPAGETTLGPGMFWRIPPEYPHSFHTEGESLDVFAWHPDSDFGPSHDHHPMVNRTIVEGVPANDPRHRGIRTVDFE